MGNPLDRIEAIGADTHLPRLSPSHDGLVKQGPLSEEMGASVLFVGEEAQQGEHDPTTQRALAFAHHIQEMHMATLRMERKLFEYAHPVDEYISSPGAPASNPVIWQPTWEHPEKIEHILYSLPIGTTSAILTLGDRIIPLYAGAALTTALTNDLTMGGLILGRDDARFLTLLPLAGPFHIELCGYADEIWGNA